MLNENRHTPVIKTDGNVEYPAHIVVSPESALVFDNAKALGNTDGAFHADSSRRYIPFLNLLPGCKVPALGHLFRMHDQSASGSIYLAADILPELTREREIIPRVDNGLVVHGTQDCLTDKKIDGRHVVMTAILTACLFFSCHCSSPFVCLRHKNVEFIPAVMKEKEAAGARSSSHLQNGNKFFHSLRGEHSVGLNANPRVVVSLCI